jgi:hypothetical protein
VECVFSRPRGGREAGSGATGWPRIAYAAAIERGEELDAAQRLDPERPVGTIRVRLADWAERALRREQSVRAMVDFTVWVAPRALPRSTQRANAVPEVIAAWRRELVDASVGSAAGPRDGDPKLLLAQILGDSQHGARRRGHGHSRTARASSLRAVERGIRVYRSLAKGFGRAANVFDRSRPLHGEASDRPQRMAIELARVLLDHDPADPQDIVQIHLRRLAGGRADQAHLPTSSARRKRV